MSPSEREFGELRSDVKGVADAVKELREINSKEHAANGARLERMEADLRAALDTKASKAWVRELDGEVRDIQGHFSEGKGVARAVSLVKGIFIVVTPFGVVLLTKALG